jgi:hypothetical protein
MNGRPIRAAEKEGKVSGAYAAISAMIFVGVALVHLMRLMKGWPVRIGPHAVPMSVSWFGLALSALLAVWGFMQLGH